MSWVKLRIHRRSSISREIPMSRVQLAINVDDLEASIDFYRRLFGTEPAKVRAGYANFAVAEPPLKLVLIENPGHGGSLNHLGVEVEDVDAVDIIQTRLAEVGLASVDERGTTCCYAVQDKFWVTGTPNGEAWEVYTVLATAPRRTAEPRARSAAPAPSSRRRPPRLRPPATAAGRRPGPGGNALSLACGTTGR